MLCPTCGDELEDVGTQGTAAVGNLISDITWFVCPARHVWAECDRPVFVGEASDAISLN